MYVIAYVLLSRDRPGRRRGRRGRLRAVGAVAGLVAVRALRLGAPASGEVLHEAVKRLLLLLADERLLDAGRRLGERELARRRDPRDSNVVIPVLGLDRALDLVLLGGEHHAFEGGVKRTL